MDHNIIQDLGISLGIWSQPVMDYFHLGLGHGWSSSYGAIQTELEELVHKHVHSKGDESDE